MRWLIETPQVDGEARVAWRARIASIDRRLEIDRGVIARAGQRDEPEVAVERDRLGLARHAGQAEPARPLAFGHHALAGERAVLATVHDQRVEIARVGHRAAHGLRFGDRAAPVGEGDRAGLGEQADLGDLAALEALGQRRRRKDADLRVVARAPQDEVDHRRIVDRRMGVGPRRELVTPPAAAAALALAIVSRCSAPGSPTKARMSMRPGRDHVAGAVDDPRLLRESGHASPRRRRRR